MVRVVGMVVLGALLTTGAALAGVLVAARASGSLFVSVLAGVVVGIVVLCGWLRFAPLARRRGARRVGAGIVVVLLAAALTATWAVPSTPQIDRAPAAQLPSARHLDRPDGTRLTVYVVHAEHATRPPLIFVHGGPGVADPAHDVPLLAALATDRDVYVYDQIGTGTSSRLNDVGDYSLARSVSDLAAVVRSTGADRVSLMGFSYGARIAVRYGVERPERLASLLVVAPAPAPVRPEQPADITAGLTRTELLALAGQLLRPRNLFVYGLTVADPQVAHRAIGDREADARFAGIYRRTTPALFCDHDLAGRVGTGGVGYFAHEAPPLLHPGSDLVSIADLRRVTAPTLVIKPGCDYVPWSAAADLTRWLPRARLVVLPGAGHAAYVERPQAFDRLVRAFWAGRPLPVPVQDPDHPPRSYTGTR